MASNGIGRQRDTDGAANHAFRSEADVKVLIIDGQQLFAEAIVLALGGREFEVLPVATTAAQGVELALRDCPDLILIDVP